MILTPLSNSPAFSRVKANVTVPLELTMIDANNAEIHSHTLYTYPIDIVLYVPGNSAFPYEITAECVVEANEGTGDRGTMTIATLCVRGVNRVSAATDLLIPAYGYAPINPAVPYDDQACREFFNQPLFPNGRASPLCRHG
jgi:hypothetical protein